MVRHASIVALSALTLAACAPSEPIDPLPPPVDGPTCQAGRFDASRSQVATEEVMSQVRGLAGERTVRFIRPGTMVTKDFRPDRLNVDIGEDGRIQRFYCG
jgi:hypothetical protein